ncbi:hypothetical protein N2152v2_005416 [Parachlorella kessleri]
MRLSVLVALFAAACLVAAEPSVPLWGDRATAITQSKALKALLDEAHSRTKGAPVQAEAALKKVFQAWQSHYGKRYPDSTTEAQRFGHWQTALQEIVDQNEKGQGWWASPNQYTDLTWDEFAKVALGTDPKHAPPAQKARSATAPGTRRLLQTAPTTVDWTPQVSPVKNQGGCGSCWAFAATAGIEAQLLIRQGKLVDQSEQQFVDCVNYATYVGYSSNGCSGGWPSNALDYAYRFNQTLESLYPYKGVTGTCNRTILSKTTNAQIQKLTSPYGYTTVATKNANALLSAVAAGPVVTTFYIETSFRSYAGGIYSPSTCTSTTVNHAMLIVGYNQTAGGPGSAGAYWKIKNSWGTSWGEKGYIRVRMDPSGPGLCAMYLYNWLPTAPVVMVAEPSSPSPSTSPDISSPSPSPSASPAPTSPAPEPSPLPSPSPSNKKKHPRGGH